MKKIVILLFTVAAMASCSNNEPLEEYTNISSEIPIKVGSVTSIAASTRSSYTGTISGINPLTARVLASRSATDFSAIPILINGDGPMTFTGQGTPGDQQYAVPYDGLQAYYPPNAITNVYLVGLYPVGGWTFAGIATMTRTFDGSNDLMTAPQAVTNRNDATSSPTTFRNLSFSHRLTLLEVQVVATGSTAMTKWGALQYLQLTGANGATPANNMTVSLSDNTTSFSGNSNLSFYITDSNTQFVGQAFPLTTTPQMAAYCIAPPVNIANTGDVGYNILVKTSQNQVGFDVPISISTVGSTEGKRITVTITFDATQPSAPSHFSTKWQDIDRFDY